MPTITQTAPLPITGTQEPQSQQPQRQESIIETPAPDATAQKVDQISPKWAALARKEKSLRQQQEAVKAKEAELKAKESEYLQKYIPKDSLASRAKSDALGLLSEFGITPDEFTQQLLNSNPTDHMIRKLEAKIQALEEANKTTTDKIQENQSEAYNQALRQIRNETKLLIDSDPSYETIKDTNSAEAVVELIKQTFDDDGTLLSVEDAAKEVENYLIEEALKLANLKKIKEKLNPAPLEQKIAEPTPQKQAMKTLTHAQTSSTKPRLSEKERVERAKMAFLGQLK